MSSSASTDKKLRFLLDENVKKELFRFLKSEGYEVTFKPKELSNGKLAAFSKSELSILVFNDRHFSNPLKFPREKIFSVVLLAIPQNTTRMLLDSFDRLLKSKSKPKDFEGFLITLKEDDFGISPIPSVSGHTFAGKA